MDWNFIKLRARRNLEQKLRNEYELSGRYRDKECYLKDYKSYMWYNGVIDLYKAAPLMWISRDRFCAELMKRGHNYYEKSGLKFFAVVNGEKFTLHENFQVCPTSVEYEEFDDEYIVCSVEVLVDRMEGWTESIKDAEQLVDTILNKRRKLDMIANIQYCNMKALTENFHDSGLNVTVQQRGKSFFLLYGMKDKPFEYFVKKVSFKNFNNELSMVGQNLHEYYDQHHNKISEAVFVHLGQGMPLPW